MAKKSEKLNSWELSVIEESLRAANLPGFDETGKEHIAILIEKIGRANSGRVYFN